MTLLKPQTFKKMAAIAKKARDNAYAPYSDHPVGAAILSGGGRIYAGTNVEAANYKGICGEGAAISAMVTAGERLIKAVVIAGPAMEYLCTPCGDCRQRLREFLGDEMHIYSLRKDGSLGGICTLEELLPRSFGPDNMAEVGHGPKKSQGPQKNDKKNKKQKKKN